MVFYKYFTSIFIYFFTHTCTQSILNHELAMDDESMCTCLETGENESFIQGYLYNYQRYREQQKNIVI